MIKYYVKHKQGRAFIYQIKCEELPGVIWQIPPSLKRYRIIAPKEFIGNIFISNFVYENEYDARVAAINEIRIDMRIDHMKEATALNEKKLFKRIALIKTIDLF